jgi:RHS repeat-associated protein
MFTGRRFDTETGLYYYRARCYSAALGRFLQTDPIGYEESVNLYQYALNNPLVLIDPLGTNVFGGLVSLIAGGGFDTSYDMGWSEAGQLSLAALEGGGKGAAAWADGVVPIWSPLEGLYANSDGSIDGVYKFSRAMGHVSRDALLAAAIPNLGQWAKNPALYEVGSKTLPGAKYAGYGLEGLGAIDKGRKIVQAEGWAAAVLPELTGAYAVTIGTGFTPGGYLLGIGAMEAADIWSSSGSVK